VRGSRYARVCNLYRLQRGAVRSVCLCHEYATDTNADALREVGKMLDTAFESPVFDSLRQLVDDKLDGRKTEYRNSELYVFATAAEEAARIKRLQSQTEERLARQKQDLALKQSQLEQEEERALASLKRTQADLQEIGAKIAKTHVQQ
jgi:hypothetical protein